MGGETEGSKGNLMEGREGQKMARWREKNGRGGMDGEQNNKGKRGNNFKLMVRQTGVMTRGEKGGQRGSVCGRRRRESEGNANREERNTDVREIKTKGKLLYVSTSHRHRVLGVVIKTFQFP